MEAWESLGLRSNATSCEGLCCKEPSSQNGHSPPIAKMPVSTCTFHLWSNLSECPSTFLDPKSLKAFTISSSMPWSQDWCNLSTLCCAGDSYYISSILKVSLSLSEGDAFFFKGLASLDRWFKVLLSSKALDWNRLGYLRVIFELEPSGPCLRHVLP